MLVSLNLDYTLNRPEGHEMEKPLCHAADELYPECGLLIGDIIQRRPCGTPCRVESVEPHRVKVRDNGSAYWLKWLTLNIAWKRVDK